MAENFKLFSENKKKGTCELNKYGISPLDAESTALNDQQGVIFSIFFKVMFLTPIHIFLQLQQISFICVFLKVAKKYCLL